MVVSHSKNKVKICFCSFPVILKWPFALHPELTKNRWSGDTPLALQLKKHMTNETRIASAAKKSSEVFQEFANSGSHTAVHGNCCYDKKRYRVTSAVRTLHNQLERNAERYDAIYTCCCAFLSFPFFLGGTGRTKLISTRSEKFKHAQIRADDGGATTMGGKKMNGKDCWLKHGALSIIITRRFSGRWLSQ